MLFSASAWALAERLPVCLSQVDHANKKEVMPLFSEEVHNMRSQKAILGLREIFKQIHASALIAYTSRIYVGTTTISLGFCGLTKYSGNHIAKT